MNPMIKKLLVALLFLSFVNIVWSQSKQIRFKRLTIDDGLSLSSVYSIHQDSKGSPCRLHTTISRYCSPEFPGRSARKPSILPGDDVITNVHFPHIRGGNHGLQRSAGTGSCASPHLPIWRSRLSRDMMVSWQRHLLSEGAA